MKAGLQRKSLGGEEGGGVCGGAGAVEGGGGSVSVGTSATDVGICVISILRLLDFGENDGDGRLILSGLSSSTKGFDFTSVLKSELDLLVLVLKYFPTFFR